MYEPVIAGHGFVDTVKIKVGKNERGAIRCVTGKGLYFLCLPTLLSGKQRNN